MYTKSPHMPHIHTALKKSIDTAHQLATMSKTFHTNTTGPLGEEYIDAHFDLEFKESVSTNNVKLSVQLSNQNGNLCQFSTLPISVERSNEYNLLSIPKKFRNVSFNVTGGEYSVTNLTSNGTENPHSHQLSGSQRDNIKSDVTAYCVRVLDTGSIVGQNTTTLLFPVIKMSDTHLSTRDIKSLATVDTAKSQIPCQLIQTSLENLGQSLQSLNRINFGQIVHHMSAQQGKKTIEMKEFDKMAGSLHSLKTLHGALTKIATECFSRSLTDAFQGKTLFNNKKTNIKTIVPSDLQSCEMYSKGVIRDLDSVQNTIGNLLTFRLPSSESILHFYTQARFGTEALEAQAEFAHKLHNLLEIRAQQVTMIQATHKNTALTHTNFNISQNMPSSAKVWSGGAYADLINVRAHYIGLSAIDETIAQHCAQLLGTGSEYKQLFPTAVHRWQLQQVMSKNVNSEITLSQTAFDHNCSLVDQMVALNQNLEVKIGLMCPATQLRLECLLHAVNKQSDVSGHANTRHTIASPFTTGLCVNRIQSNKTAQKLDLSFSDSPHFKLDIEANQQNLAVCQLNALVNSDYLHRILPPLLHKKLSTHLKLIAQNNLTPLSPPLDHTQTAKILSMFDEHLAPLARVAFLNEKLHPSAKNGLAFVSSPAIQTGYNADVCFETLVDEIFVH